MAFLSLLGILTKIQNLRFGLRTSGKTFIHPMSVVKIEKGGLLHVGSDVVFSSNTYVECKRKAHLIINDGGVLNSSSRIQSYNYIELGEKVIVGPFSYLCDFMHNYQDVTKAIKDQGCTTKGEIHIGNGTWIGASVTILAPVRIGKGCVIGANSLVNKDIPDYSVAVGNPARIVKQYDEKSGRWIKV